MGNKNDSVIDLETMTFLRKDGSNEGKTHRHKNRLMSLDPMRLKVFGGDLNSNETRHDQQ